MKSSTVTALAALSIAHLVSSQSTTQSGPEVVNTYSYIPGAVASGYLGSYASYFTGAEETSIGNAIIAVVTSVESEAAYTSFVEDIYAAVPTSLRESFLSAFVTEDWDHVTAEPWFSNVNPNAAAFETSVENIIESTVAYVVSVLGTPSALLTISNTQSTQSQSTTSTGSGSGSLTTSTSAPSTTAPPTTSSAAPAAPAGTTSSTSTSKAGAAKVTGVAYAGAAVLGLVGAMIAL